MSLLKPPRRREGQRFVLNLIDVLEHRLAQLAELGNPVFKIRGAPRADPPDTTEAPRDLTMEGSRRSLGAAETVHGEAINWQHPVDST